MTYGQIYIKFFSSAPILQVHLIKQETRKAVIETERTTCLFTAIDFQELQNKNNVEW